MNINERANVLVESLPFIQKFNGKIIVVKYGGNAMINEELQESVINDIVLMKCVGFKPVIVHGGGPFISSFLKRDFILSGVTLVVSIVTSIKGFIS